MRTLIEQAQTWFRWRLDLVRQAREMGVRVGADCRIYDCDFGSEPYLVSLGNHVTVSTRVQFITHDGGVWVFRQEFPDIDVFAPISVGNNVFIGAFSIILPGASIGDNCVVGAGSVVTGVIPANSVVAGVPARMIRTMDEYRAKVIKDALHVRQLSATEKRRVLCEKFGLK